MPLDNPASAHLLGSFDLGEHEGDPVEICHDFGVILGKVNMGACAGHGVAIFDLSDPAQPRAHVHDDGADGRSLPLGGLHLGRQDHRLRLGAGRRHRAALPGDRGTVFPAPAAGSRPRR